MRSAVVSFVTALLVAGGVAFGTVTVTVREAGTGNSTINVAPGGIFSVDVIVTPVSEGTGISGAQLSLAANGPASGVLSVAGPADQGTASQAINSSIWDADVSATGTGLPLVTGALPKAPLGAGASSLLTGSSRLMTVQMAVDPAGATGSYEVNASGLAFPDFISNTDDIVVTPDSPLTVVVGTTQTCSRTIADRKIFYNNSYWDGNNPAVQANSAANNHDDDSDAIATDKVALLPGGTGAFANYVSFDKSITGIMVDIAPGAGCSALNVSTADFEFRVGNTATPSSWPLAAAPSAVVVTAGGGTGGSDRVTITWATDAIPNHNWLRVTVLANANTGLAASDVFYFGVAKGEANSPTSAQAVVNSTDELAARTGPRVVFPSRTAITNILDFNRDGFENSSDDLISRNNSKAFPTALKLTTLP